MFENLIRVDSAPREFDWGWALPSTIRAIADPSAHVGLPACPMVRPGGHDAAFQLALGYWTALDHVLRYQLGWTHPAQGLARCQDEGWVADCPALDLVRQVWWGDGFLDRYLAWRVEKCGDHVPAHWVGRLRVRHVHGAEGEPVGPWQLHLEEHGGHALLPLDGPPPEVRVLSTGLSVKMGAVIRKLDAMISFDDPGGLESGWYGYLMDVDPALTSIEVYARRHGLCGLYRRSPVSGRWHTAPEPVHQWGIRP